MTRQKTPGESRTAAYYGYRAVASDDPTQKTTNALADQEWTRAAFQQVSRLAQHALTAGTAYGLREQDRPLPVVTGRLIRRTSALAERLHKHEVCLTREDSVAVALTWTELLASVGEDKALAALDSQFVKETPKWHQAFGRTAVLAWAAGLTFEETQARQVANTLDNTSLAALAVLRGVRWPR